MSTFTSLINDTLINIAALKTFIAGINGDAYKTEFFCDEA